MSPWGVIGAGRLRSDAEEKKREETGEAGRKIWGENWRRTEAERKTSNALEQVSKELGGGFSVSAGEKLLLDDTNPNSIYELQSRLHM